MSRDFDFVGQHESIALEHLKFPHAMPSERPAMSIFHRLGLELQSVLPKNCERSTALYKLIEAGDAALRALRLDQKKGRRK